MLADRRRQHAGAGVERALGGRGSACPGAVCSIRSACSFGRERGAGRESDGSQNCDRGDGRGDSGGEQKGPQASCHAGANRAAEPVARAATIDQVLSEEAAGQADEASAQQHEPALVEDELAPAARAPCPST